MERLTHRYTSGMAWASIFNVVARGETECTGPIIDRLASYEDTNLTPEEIMGLCSMDRRAKMADLLRMEENKPLALEQLREMCGEPVWVERHDGGQSGWAIVGDFKSLYGVYFATARGGLRLPYDEYGKTWVAYRRRPEEAVKEADSLINRTLPELTREKLAEEYLNICDHDCGVDRSVGIPACPFYDPPDVDGSGASVPEWCKLDAILKGAAEPQSEVTE